MEDKPRAQFHAAMRYRTPEALRRALEDRMIAASRRGEGELPRMRRQVAFDRLLSRLCNAPLSPWLLKGGYAMELRIASARTTRDIDLAMRLPLHTGDRWDSLLVRKHLQTQADTDLEDGFSYLIEEARMELDAAPYGGARFPIEASMGGRSFSSFHLDVSAGDVLCEPYEILEGRDWLGFAGIQPPKIPAVSREEQFAEKLHAFTLPREGRPNSRVRDLVDLLLLIESNTLERDRLTACIAATFERRKTHPVPRQLEAPPATWSGTYAELAARCAITQDVTLAFTRLSAFYSELSRL
jgi:hypothetical protein